MKHRFRVTTCSSFHHEGRCYQHGDVVDVADPEPLFESIEKNVGVVEYVGTIENKETINAVTDGRGSQVRPVA